MTTNDKKGYIERMMGLVERAEDYRSAAAHADFVRGVMAAWNFDLTISLEAWKKYNTKLEAIMVEKYKLRTVAEGAPF